MGAEISAAYTTSTGEPAVGKMFGKHSFGLRGVVDVPGEIHTGDRVVLEVACLNPAAAKGKRGKA